MVLLWSCDVAMVMWCSVAVIAGSYQHFHKQRPFKMSNWKISYVASVFVIPAYGTHAHSSPGW